MRRAEGIRAGGLCHEGVVGAGVLSSAPATPRPISKEKALQDPGGDRQSVEEDGAFTSTEVDTHDPSLYDLVTSHR